MEFFDRFRALAGSAREKASVGIDQDVQRLIVQGNLFEDQGLLQQALACYDEAIRMAPSFARAHLNRGNILLETGDVEGALAACATALAHDPGYAAAQYNSGNAYRRLGCNESAQAAYKIALELKPNFVDAEVALGGVQEDLGLFDDALASYRRALALRPEYAEVYSNLGTVLKALGRFDEAMVSYRRALEINPGFADGYVSLGNAFNVLGAFDHAEASYRQALKLKPDFIQVYSSLLFSHSYRSDQDILPALSDAQCYGKVVALQAQRPCCLGNVPAPSRCLRIGFVSGDLRQHPVGNFLEAVFAMLAKQAAGRLQLFAYASHFVNDEVTERIKAHCHGWRSAVGQSDESLAQRIRDDSIDILIDLSGHTAHNRLPVFAWKPAPVQATWLGYLATTGVSTIDYVIADAWTFPESEQINFTEKVWRLPESYLCFTPPSGNVEVGPLPAISNGYFTFGSFNNLSKMNDAVVALWSRVLFAVPGSRLYLKSPQLKEISVQQSVLQRFADHGISVERLILEGSVPRAEYLKPFRRVDIALDTFPYPGITTSVETLWMGVPVLTLSGKSFLSRQGVGLLMNAGLPDWIAEDADEYVARAVLHAGDLQKLAMLRSGLRQRILASPIFDAPRFAQHFETALRGMWQKWCDQQQEQSS
jgi:predicted O-linked N-acetylglucosamine transferase (SPINDLY family)